MDRQRVFQACSQSFAIGARTYIMGILNITPDSFSDGGNFIDPDIAVARALAMIEEGADILDIGGESTRPGHRPLSADEEAARILPVIRRLHGETGTAISVDTSKASVARAAVDAGACIINDVRALRADPDMVRTAAETGAGLVLMYNASPMLSGVSDPDPSWSQAEDLFSRIIRYLSFSIRMASDHGIGANRLMIDPGIGFGVTAEESCTILRRLSELAVLEAPVLIGPSRKSFIGKTLNLPVEDRLMGTAAAVALGIANGADFIRVHDVLDMTRVARMADAIMRRGCDG